jgi:hypothetical protein
MKKRYTHFDTTQFSEVVEVQEQLLITGEVKGDVAVKEKSEWSGTMKNLNKQKKVGIRQQGVS